MEGNGGDTVFQLRTTVCSRPVLAASQDKDPTQAYLNVWTGIGAKWEAVVATLDSGTPDQWISDQVLNRLPGVKEAAIDPKTYWDFQGGKYQATRSVVLTWHSQKERKTRKGVFLVMDDAPFDIIIGWKLLFKEGIYVFNEAALLFFHKPPTSGEEARMQQTLAEQQDTLAQHLAERAARQEASRHQQRTQLEQGWYEGGIREYSTLPCPLPASGRLQRPESLDLARRRPHDQNHSHPVSSSSSETCTGPTGFIRRGPVVDVLLQRQSNTTLLNNQGTTDSSSITPHSSHNSASIIVIASHRPSRCDDDDDGEVRCDDDDDGEVRCDDDDDDDDDDDAVIGCHRRQYRRTRGAAGGGGQEGRTRVHRNA